MPRNHRIYISRYPAQSRVKVESGIYSNYPIQLAPWSWPFCVEVPTLYKYIPPAASGYIDQADRWVQNAYRLPNIENGRLCLRRGPDIPPGPSN